MSSADTARADAVRTLTWYLTRRDQTAPADRADAEVDAAEAVQALWARGWRPTAVQPTPPWLPNPSGDRAAPDAVHRHAAAAREALARSAQEATDEH